MDVALRARSEEERAAELRKLLVAVQRSSRLAEQLLDLARLEAGEPAQVRSRCDLQEIEIGILVRNLVDNAVRVYVARRQGADQLRTL
jgi:signal transduction histidine kinase